VFGSEDGPDIILVAYAPELLRNTFNIWDVNYAQRLIFLAAKGAKALSLH
jgi:hypothetical protein